MNSKARVLATIALDQPDRVPLDFSADAAALTRLRNDVLGSGGGLILSPSHVLQTDVPTENVVAMYETAYSCGAYGV